MENRRMGNRPAEIFGYPPHNQTAEAQKARERHWCPFLDKKCIKQSRLIQYPFGVCSVEQRGVTCAICPQRFEELNPATGNSRVLGDIAQHYFGSIDNVLAFPEVKLPNIGSIDYVLVRHKPLRAEVEDFVAVEFQTDSTTGTGAVVQGLEHFVGGQDIITQTYHFGMNTYDTIKRSMTQLFNKGIVYEKWNTHCYWVIQEYIYTNLARRYSFKPEEYTTEHASRFALYEFVTQQGRLCLQPTRIISTTVDEVYQAMRHNPGIPGKDDFVNTLNTKLKARLKVQFE